MEIEPSEFEDIPLDSMEESSCSPKPERKPFTGVLIRVPSRIAAGKGERLVIPVCGFYNLDVWPLMQGAQIRVAAQRIDEDGAALPPMVSLLQSSEEPVDEPLLRDPDQPPMDESLYEGVQTGGYFNFDAAANMPAPFVSGTWEITVAYGEVKSEPSRVVIDVPGILMPELPK